MAKFLIVWNTKYGDSAEVIEAKVYAEANAAAYEAWREDAENSAAYKALLYTKEIAEDYGVE